MRGYYIGTVVVGLFIVITVSESVRLLGLLVAALGVALLAADLWLRRRRDEGR